MFQKLKLNLKRVYPTLVVSTMSSGKSTLINALVGTEMLPSSNLACTAKPVYILDNDSKNNFGIHLIDNKGKYVYTEENRGQLLKAFNNTDDFSEIIIEGQIRGIKNSKKSLLMIDTPGINNIMDQTHASVTKEVLDEYAEGLILYILNAAQLSTYDDREFLSYIVQKLKSNPGFDIVFAVNKMDEIDPEKENPNEVIRNCRQYIENLGIENPTLVPTAAKSALLFKKALNGEPLSRYEKLNFDYEYQTFRGSEYSFPDYAYIPERGILSETVEIRGIKYTRAQLYAALYNTGVPLLETVMDEALVKSLKMKAPRVTRTKPDSPSENAKSKRS